MKNGVHAAFVVFAAFIACGGLEDGRDAAADAAAEPELDGPVDAGTAGPEKCYVLQDPLKLFACDGEADCSSCPEACSVEGFDAAGACK